MLSLPPFFLLISLVCFAGREQQRANKRSCNVYALLCRLEEEEKSLTFLTNSLVVSSSPNVSKWCILERGRIHELEFFMNLN